MINPSSLDEAYKEFTKDLGKFLPDGIVSINLQTLHDMGILNSANLEKPTPDNLSHQFHVVETYDKVTLYNEQFAVWIIPQNSQENQSTLAMIALLQNNKPHLEIAYSTSGVYNTPRYILKILQHYLVEVLDTEAILSLMNKKKD